MERALAKIVRIDSVEKHPNADALSICTVGGWRVVTSLDAFKEGDLACYFEIDSWIPYELAPFLSKGKEPREYEGVKGERLRTVKLRQELSQGLLLPGTPCPTGVMLKQYNSVAQHIFQEGDDVTEWLGVKKYEKDLPASLAGNAKGNFPTCIPKTNAERVQNLNRNLEKWVKSNIQFEVTLKLDGSSMTVANIDGEIYVCSRNLSLKLDQEGNAFIDTAKRYGLIDNLMEFGKNIAIQGELIGPGIQGNQEKLSKFEFRVFEIYDIDNRCYFNVADRYSICEQFGLLHVPVHAMATLRDLGVNSVADALKIAEGPSLTPDVQREGLVFKSLDGSVKFKAISNTWLLKNE